MRQPQTPTAKPPSRQSTSGAPPAPEHRHRNNRSTFGTGIRFAHMFMVAALVLSGIALFSGPASAQPPYKIMRTGGQGVFLRIDGPSFSSRKAAGPNDGQTDFTVICQTTGESYSGSTIWDYIEYRGNRGYINDYFVFTGYDGFDPRLPRCGAAPADPFTVSGVFATARDRNGVTNVGRPTNAVHRWGAGDVQDFNSGSWGWNIIMQSDANRATAYVVRTGFWQWYRANNNQGLATLGYPTSEEYAHGSGARQNFQRAMLEWRPGVGTVVVAYPAVKPPTVTPPTPTPPTATFLEPIAEYRGKVRTASQAIAQARSVIGSRNWEVGGSWCGSPRCQYSGCLNFTWWVYTNGMRVVGKGYQTPLEMINGGNGRPAVPGIVRSGIPPAGAIVLYTSPNWAGHAAISIGGGRVISQGVAGKIGEAAYTAFTGYYGYIPFSG